MKMSFVSKGREEGLSVPEAVRAGAIANEWLVAASPLLTSRSEIIVPVHVVLAGLIYAARDASFDRGANMCCSAVRNPCKHAQRSQQTHP